MSNTILMQFLKIKTSKNKTRVDGTKYSTPVFVTKTKKYGKVINEKTISVKRSILITGAHDSGKSRWINRLYKKAPQIWGAKIKAEPIILGALLPLTAWSDSIAVQNWWESERKKEEKSNSNRPRIPWSKLKQWERAEILPTYIQETAAVLFIDDAHKLAGRKLQVARLCVISAKISVVSASEEQRIPPNLRGVLMRKEPQIFRLNSEVAYDATNILMWFLIVACVVMGAWEAGLILGGLKALGTGRRAAKPD
jgi:hypothetical protein